MMRERGESRLLRPRPKDNPFHFWALDGEPISAEELERLTRTARRFRAAQRARGCPECCKGRWRMDENGVVHGPPVEYCSTCSGLYQERAEREEEQGKALQVRAEQEDRRQEEERRYLEMRARLREGTETRRNLVTQNASHDYDRREPGA
jgi:hypothetical protein